MNLHKPPSSKKFRFDSFATEFSEDNIKKETEPFPDNDSGIGELIFFFFILKYLHQILHYSEIMKV